MKKYIVFLVSAVCFLTPFISDAASKSPFSRETPSIMQSVRALGMGNAFYGLSDDKYATFYNPAGLGKVRKWYVDVIPLTIGVNDNLLKNGKKAFDTYSNNSNGLDDPQAISDLINDLMGGYTNIAPVSFFPAFTKKNLSVGLFANADFNLLAYNSVLPELALRTKADVGAIVGYAMQFLEDDALSVGVSLKGLYRINFTKSYTATELAGLFASGSQSMRDLEHEIRREGTGYAILGTVGVMYDLPVLKVIKPSVGASFNDFGYADFGNLMESIDPTLNISISIAPEFGFITTALVVDFTDVLMSASNDSFSKHVNIGAEVQFWHRLAIRAGLHQGYPTLGAGFDLTYVKANYAYYSEELGAYAGQYKDTRHAIEFVIGF